MRYLDLTLPTGEENLALDEALLEEAEAADGRLQTLRIWEPLQPMVVLGRSSRIAAEVRQAECRALGVPILRRASGGAAIVTGPGCLMYSLVLDYRERPALRAVNHAHRFVLGTIEAALRLLLPGVASRGISDLAIGEAKFSGNSMRCKLNHFLYHGTILYDFPLELIERCLTVPPRQPAYRQGRAHRDFVTNLPLSRQQIRDVLRTAWNALEPCEDWPSSLTQQIVAERRRDFG